MTLFLAHLSGWFMKIAFMISHLKYQLALATGNIHVIFHHWTFVEGMNTIRPFLRWSPV